MCGSCGSGDVAGRVPHPRTKTPMRVCMRCLVLYHRKGGFTPLKPPEPREGVAVVGQVRSRPTLEQVEGRWYGPRRQGLAWFG